MGTHWERYSSWRFCGLPQCGVLAKNALPSWRRVGGMAVAINRAIQVLTGLAMASAVCSVHATQEMPKAQPAEARMIIEAKFAAVNRHDVDAIVAFYSKNARLHASDFCSERVGQAEVRRTYEAIFAFASEIHAEVEELIVEGDQVAARVLLSSTTPEMNFELPITNFFTVANGKITRDLGMFDNRGRPCRP